MLKKVFILLLIFINSTTTAYENYHDLTKKLDFTPFGIKEFLREIYNNAEYSKNILPYSFEHLRQFVSFGKKTSQGADYLEQVLKLFRQKLIECECICSKEAISITQFLGKKFSKFNKEEKNNPLCSTVKDVCYDEFLNNFEQFKSNPDEFLTILSNKIINKIIPSTCKLENETHNLENVISKFLETCVSKTIWSTEGNIKVWTEFKELGESIYELKTQNIISDEDSINDIIKILNERFIYFLRLAGQNFTSEFFETARNDILSGKLTWLEIEELEKEITPKLDTLRRTLIQVQIKAEANQRVFQQ